jgi:hypothetical protein
MLKNGIFAIAALFSMVVISLPAAANPGEIQQANATLGAIDRDRISVHGQAAHFYQEMSRAQAQLRWHDHMERVRAEEMTRSDCARPQSQGHWAHCNGLYNMMQMHARWRQHLAAIADHSRARHMAAVQQLDQIARADHWWRNHLAALTAANPAVASGQQPAVNPLETGSVDGGKWSRVVR